MSANKLVLGQDGLVVGNNQLVVSGDGISTGSVATKKLGVSNGVTITGGVYANGSLGTNGQVLTSNGTDVYWGVVAGTGSGAGVNVAEQYVWTNTHTFQNTVTINSTLGVGNTSVSGFVNATSSVNALSVTVGTSFIANATGAYTTGVVNAASHTTTGVTANVTGVYPASNSSGIELGSATARWNLLANTGNFSTTLAAGNTSVTGFVNATTSVNSALLSVGTSFIANTLGAYHTGTVNAASITTTGVTTNVTGVYPTSNSSGFTLGSATQRWVINGNTLNLSGVLTTTSGINANGSLGTAGQVLTTNGSVAYWTAAVVNTAAPYTWTNTHTFSNLVSIGNSTSNVEISAGTFSFNNVAVQANGSFGTAGQILTSNSTGLYWSSVVNATSISTSGFTGNTLGIYPSSNSIELGNTTSRWSIYGSAATISGLTIISTVASNLQVTNQTTGSILLGGPTQTGSILLGQSTANQTVSIANGATTSGNVKVLSIGENGAAGSQTNITIGSSSSNTQLSVNANNTLFSGQVNAAAFNTTGVTINTIAVSIGSAADIILNSAAGISANGTFGTAGQALLTNGSAAYWGSAGGGSSGTGTGSGTDTAFFINGQTVNTNYTTAATSNYLSAGPITVASGVTVTITPGSRWAIV